MQTRSVRERFFEKVQVCEHGTTCEECHWPWLAGTKHGHGKFYLRSEGRRRHKRKVDIRAEVYMYVIAYGKVPPHDSVQQGCHEDLCVNYHHLTTRHQHVNALRAAYDLEHLLTARSNGHGEGTV